MVYLHEAFRNRVTLSSNLGGLCVLFKGYDIQTCSF